jgi:thiamine-phosphate pyrophosphorylase
MAFLYDLVMTLANSARRLNRTTWQPWDGPALALLSDPVRLADPRAAMMHLPAGSGVWLRALDPALAAPVMRLARMRRLVVMVAGDWRLAAALGAQGLHLPESMARHGVLAPALGWLRRRGTWLSVACHARPALGRAKALGAACALVSPVFSTRSHPGARGLGALRLAALSRQGRMPVLALGGIGRQSARRIIPGSAAGLAAIGGLTQS